MEPDLGCCLATKVYLVLTYGKQTSPTFQIPSGFTTLPNRRLLAAPAMSTRMKEIVRLPINLQRKTHIPKLFMVVSRMALIYWLVVGGMIHHRNVTPIWQVFLR
jgi:hypothetical protein